MIKRKDSLLTFALFRRLILMIYQYKHTNLPMNVLETIRQGGWHVYNYYYFGMGYDNSILFSRFHGSNSRNLSQSCNRLGTLHCETYYHRHSAVRRSKQTQSPRCVSPILSGFCMGNERTVEASDNFACQNVLSDGCNNHRSGRYSVSSQSQLQLYRYSSIG